MLFIKNKKKEIRKPNNAVIAYQKEVAIREKDLPWPDKVMFTNDFDAAMTFRVKLLRYIPDLPDVLSDLEIDTIIDLVADETCKDLRKKGLLSEESKNIIGR